MELNREDIIKALEWCSSGGACSKCAENEANLYLSREGCMSVQMQNALTLIKQLTEENENLHATCTELTQKVQDVARAIFEKLEKLLIFNTYEIATISKTDFDNLKRNT